MLSQYKKVNSQNIKRLSFYSLFLIILCLPLTIFGEESANDIAYKVSKRETGRDQKSIMTMQLINKRNQSRVRTVEWYTMDSPQGKKKFIRFIKPADVAGTTFLGIEHKGSDDEQRLYLPTLQKVRKISSSKKSSSFMGTDITYEDLEERKYEDYNYQFLRKENVGDILCTVIKYTPKKGSQYKELHVFVDTKIYFARKVNFYDKDGKLLKTMLNHNIEKIKEIYIAKKVHMLNHQDIHQTIMTLDNVEINTGLSSSIFTVLNMKK